MKHQRIFSVLAGVLVMLFAGFVYAWSILSAPIAAEFSAWSSAQLSLAFTICMAFFCLGGLTGGMMLNKVSAGFNIRLAAVLFLCGFFITSRLQSLPALYIGYGVLCGTASGFAYNAVMSTVPKWFPNRQGLISGVLLMGFGASSLMIGSAFTVLTPAQTGAWRTSLLIMGILMAVILGLCSFFFHPATAEVSVSKASGDFDMASARMVRHPSFWCFFAWATLLSAAGLAVIGQARPIVLTVRPALSAGAVSLVVGMISVCNGLGRIVIGALFDRFGARITMSTVISLFLIGTGSIAFSSVLSSFPLLIAGYAALGMGYGGDPTTGASLTQAFFGSKHYSVNFSLVNLNLMIASLGSTAVGALYDASGNYSTTFVFLFACILLGGIAMLGVRKPEYFSSLGPEVSV